MADFSDPNTMDSPPRTPSYILVDGFRLPVAFYPPAFRAALQYKAQPDDVFLATYPKCGTTWMQYILYMLYNKGKVPQTFFELRAISPHIEMMGVEAVDAMNRPGVIRTHLPADKAPYSPQAKYIWVIRNPKDCCLSYYHHTECTGGVYDFEGGQFDDYFELFIKGEVDFGDYFDHLLSWYNRRSDSNFLMVTYEEMKTDLSAVIRKVARFLGNSYGYDLEQEPDIFNRIVENCGLQNMKANTDRFAKTDFTERKENFSNLTPGLQHFFGVLSKHKSYDNPRYRIVRKGIVGGWRDVFTSDQNQRMNEKIEKKLGGTEILAYWKDIGCI